MKIKYLFVILICFLLTENIAAQATDSFTWWNPAGNAFPVLEGQAWPKEVKSFYDRLPARAEQAVRKAVWDLSRHSAGLYIKFRTNASNIVVRYGVTSKGSFAMPHMPATGVSGVDLYAIDHSGNWVWAPGKYHFSDTITYQYANIEVDRQFKGRDCEFRLFLPLYNAVSWMEIGVPEGNTFIPMPLSEE
ncbi:SGNH/GDSL hydrolase N-terminal domain-containing protein, partial [Agriterribacter sp.]|uniref:SGNH/GDSL hydrolase N-terminal domain-containing protein n=1 Tax=Agriterribacter sp. TaxID=2821509 RepID=UPI002C92D363